MSDYNDVGYGKPPKKYQFQKGKSGNPKGRPRKQPTVGVDVNGILNDPQQVRLNGEIVEMSPKEAELRQMMVKALKDGELNAIIYLLRQFEKYGVVLTPKPTDGGVVRLPPGMPSAMGMILLINYKAPYSKADIAAAAVTYKAQRSENDRLLDEFIDYPALRP
ncbi:MAG: DUF5681 domain-containing protein [Sphingomonadales bacterium]